MDSIGKHCIFLVNTQNVNENKINLNLYNMAPLKSDLPRVTVVWE